MVVVWVVAVLTIMQRVRRTDHTSSQTWIIIITINLTDVRNVVRIIMLKTAIVTVRYNQRGTGCRMCCEDTSGCTYGWILDDWSGCKRCCEFREEYMCHQ